MPPADAPMPSASVEEADLGIEKGTIIESGKYRWNVDVLLGEGGFGAVYRVHEEGNPAQYYAMKVEQLDARPNNKLKMEIAILKMVSQERTEQRSHFTKIKDRGKKEKFAFLVMQLVGKSLLDMKHDNKPKEVFSIGTGIGVAIQSLEAVQDLHKYEFLHRDIKPANFACGLGELRRTIYILDFGMARKLTNESNELKTPRIKVAFKGTVRFASLACHRNTEMSCKDDCESWFYMLLDLVTEGGLPWRRAKEKDEVLRLKQDARENKCQAMLKQFKEGREEIYKIVDYIDHLTYTDRVDYDYIYTLLKLAAAANKASLDAPYDWERSDKAAERTTDVNPYDPQHNSQTLRTAANRKNSKAPTKTGNKGSAKPEPNAKK
ncbi:Protein C27D8.1 [Aphelenchoides avenae]|nr:Protein C27D8.1 [Aphelenchus avenae]